MTINYNVIWIDEDKEWVDAWIIHVMKVIKDQYFEPNIIYLEDDKELENKIHENYIDLILLDYKLINKTGDEIIRKIRDNDIFNYILFYSQEKDFMDDLVGLELVFYCQRVDLISKLSKIIPLTIETKNDITSMRGTIIGETIEIENKINEIILKFFNKNESMKNVTEKLISPQFDALELKKKWDLLNTITTEKIKEFENKYKDTNGTEKEENKIIMQELTEAKSVLKDLYIDIIEIRNIMGHTKSTGTKKNVLISYIHKGEICVDSKFCTDQRAKFSIHSLNLDKILNHV